MKIQTKELLDLIDILKNSIKRNLGDFIEIKTEDFYWDIPSEELYNPTKEPQNLMLGQLSDDWEELLRLKKDKETPISYDLKRLSIILEIVQEKSRGIW